MLSAPSDSDSALQAAQRIGSECLAGRIRFLNRSLTSIYDDAFRPLGVTAGQISILSVVINYGTATPSNLVSDLNMEKSTVSRNLERMRKAGLVDIKSQGRNQQVSATEEGRSLLERALPFWQEAQTATGLLLGADGAQDLRKVADVLRSKLT